MGEIETEGLNPNKLFGSVTTTHKPMTDLVKRVLNKEIEVAFIASCILENMERKNFEGDLSSIKVVNENLTITSIVVTLLTFIPAGCSPFSRRWTLQLYEQLP